MTPTPPLESWKDRAQRAKEARERYTVDNGKICICDRCGAQHYKRKAVEEAEKQK